MDTKDMADWLYAKQGINLCLNNQADLAEVMLKKRLDSLNVSVAYSYLTFMNALMSFEEDKIQLAFQTLRDIEKKCAGDMGWLKSIKNRFTSDHSSKNLADTLEEQIILADTQMCIALLTFLQQDITGYMKGAWVLRKAWKIYQHTYTQIHSIYRQTFGSHEEINGHGMPASPVMNMFQTPSTPGSLPSCSDNCDWSIPNSTATTPEPNSEYPDTSTPSSDQNYSNSSGSTNNNIKNIPTLSYSPDNISRENLKLDLNGTGNFISMDTSGINSLGNGSRQCGTGISNGYIRSPLYLFSPLRFFGTTSNPISNIFDSSTSLKNNVEPTTLARLMSAVSFGYGVFQLSVSLLPPNLLRIIHFLGFEGDRGAGITSLMYARQGDDMRAPLATLALLWYHTILRPFCAVDGAHVHPEVDSAQALIDEAQNDYAESALFLFFKGRVERLKCNTPRAIDAYQAAFEVSTQWEIQILCLHEIGWCRLTQRDFVQARNCFSMLSHRSRWSRSFYGYIAVICQGSSGQFDGIINAKAEVIEMLKKSMHKEQQAEKYIGRRIKKFPSERDEWLSNVVYWRLYTYEMIILWNALTNCRTQEIEAIIKDCNTSQLPTFVEPIRGLAQLVLGMCYCALEQWDDAIMALKQSIQQRSEPHCSIGTEDGHVSAYARYELAMIAIRKPETQAEAKLLLLQAQQFKDYDFENRLTARIQIALKRLNTA